MCCGVLKSGSPAPKPMTDFPSAFIALALAVMARVREGEMEPLSAQGYISLGHTFRPADNEIRYRYITTSPEPFRGRRMAIDEDQDPLSSLTSITSASVGLGM